MSESVMPFTSYCPCPQCGKPKKLSARLCKPCSVTKRYGTPMERFKRSVDVRADGCWWWTAGVSTCGYGRFYWNGKKHQAHRVSYELERGPIPDGLQLDHLCRNPKCVNPAHLEPVTAHENQLRGVGTFTQTNRHKTHCPYGHPLDGRKRTGARYCLTCQRQRNHAYYQANAERQRQLARARYRRDREAARKELRGE